MGPLTVRRAAVADAPEIAAIHIRSWQAAYHGVLPNALLDALSVTEREEHWQAVLNGASGRWLTLVAKGPGGALAGLCSAEIASPDEGAGAARAEIGALYVDPDHWRRGAGTALLTAALDDLRERGCHEAVLWVLPENHAALAFYGRLGFSIEPGVEKIEERSGRSVVRLRVALA
jgi:ribosomal protein S18 acetylase RimI-like enzyme